jgi:RNA polymerase sporulation-specific sigma factor
MRTISARSKKAPIRSDIISEENESEELSVEETPESIYLYKEFISELLNGMNTLLTPVEKSALELSMEGVSYRSAADKMGISEKSVDNAIQRARRKLRSLINKLNMTV